jgi:hypothetical protein
MVLLALSVPVDIIRIRKNAMPKAPIDEARIRETAYRLWQEDGEPEGRDQDHWAKAIEALTSAEPEPTTPAKPARKPAAKTAAKAAPPAAKKEAKPKAPAKPRKAKPKAE